MEINEKCPNCHKPNLIHRVWRSITFPDIWCGWCESVFKLVESKLVIFETNNAHLTAMKKERLKNKEVMV